MASEATGPVAVITLVGFGFLPPGGAFRLGVGHHDALEMTGRIAATSTPMMVESALDEIPRLRGRVRVTGPEKSLATDRIAGPWQVFVADATMDDLIWVNRHTPNMLTGTASPQVLIDYPDGSPWCSVYGGVRGLASAVAPPPPLEDLRRVVREMKTRRWL